MENENFDNINMLAFHIWILYNLHLTPYMRHYSSICMCLNQSRDVMFIKCTKFLQRPVRIFISLESDTLQVEYLCTFTNTYDSE